MIQVKTLCIVFCIGTVENGENFSAASTLSSASDGGHGARKEPGARTRW